MYTSNRRHAVITPPRVKQEVKSELCRGKPTSCRELSFSVVFFEAKEPLPGPFREKFWVPQHSNIMCVRT